MLNDNKFPENTFLFLYIKQPNKINLARLATFMGLITTFLANHRQKTSQTSACIAGVSLSECSNHLGDELF